MKKVKDTKNPTVRQLRNIARNLKEHLNTFAVASIGVRCYSPITSEKVEYGIYIERDGNSTHIFKSWSELLLFYHELMKEEI